MAINKLFETNTLAIEVEVDIDSDNNPIYKKKSIGKIKDGADISKVAAVVNAISDVLDKDTRYFYLTEVSKVQQ